MAENARKERMHTVALTFSSMYGMKALGAWLMELVVDSAWQNPGRVTTMAVTKKKELVALETEENMAEFAVLVVACWAKHVVRYLSSDNFLCARQVQTTCPAR